MSKLFTRFLKKQSEDSRETLSVQKPSDKEVSAPAPLPSQVHLRISKAIFDAGHRKLRVNGWCLTHANKFDLFLTVPGTSIIEHVPAGREPRPDVHKKNLGYDTVTKPGWRVEIPASNLPSNAEVHVFYVDAEQRTNHRISVDFTAASEATGTKQEHSEPEFDILLDKCEYSPLRSLGTVKLSTSKQLRDSCLELATSTGRKIPLSTVSARWRQKGKRYFGELRFPLAGIAGGEALQIKVADGISEMRPFTVLQDSKRRRDALSPSVLNDISALPGQLSLQEMLALRSNVTERPQEISPGTVCYFPVFDESAPFSDHFHRASWYIGGATPIAQKVTFGMATDALELQPAPAAFDPACLEPGVGFEQVYAAGEYHNALLSSAVILIWKSVSKSQLSYIKKLFPGKHILAVSIEDPSAAEYGSYCRIPWLLLTPEARQKELTKSQERLRKLYRRERDKGKKTAAVFGTGPSIDKAFEFDFEKVMTIACNTIVASDDLLDHLNPALITAGDAVSHFGVSRYAARYRKDLIRCLETRDAYFLTTAAMGFVFVARHPEIKDRVILCDQTHNGINIDLEDVWSLPRFDSTLNIHMLPAAANYSDTIFLLGFDGKNPNPKENEDFWAHSQQAHYHDLVDTGHECHPTFSINRAQATADRYLASVEESISAAECLGKKFYSLLPSFTPGLQARPVPEHCLVRQKPESRLMPSSVPQEAKAAGKRALVVMKSPRAHFSGGRYHGTMLALSLGAFCDEVVIWSNNYMPWIHELAASPFFDKLKFVVNDFISIPEGKFDYVVMVPDLNPEVCVLALNAARENKAKTALVNFESPNWFNAMSPEPRPLEEFTNWYAAGCFTDVILCSAKTAVPFAERFYANPFHEQLVAVAPPAINDPIARIAMSNPPKKESRITVFGRFGAVSKHKNLDGLLEILPDELPGYTLTLVAGTSNKIDPEEIQEMEGALEQRGMKLELLSMISDHAKFTAIAASELVLFPSLFEGFGYPPVEAAFVGTPCLMYELPVLVENNSDHGYFAPIGDVATMKEKVLQILAMPAEERMPKELPKICTTASQVGFSESLKSAFSAVDEPRGAEHFSEEKFLAAQKIYSDRVHMQEIPFHTLTDDELKNVISFYRSKLNVLNDAVDCLGARLKREDTPRTRLLSFRETGRGS